MSEEKIKIQWVDELPEMKKPHNPAFDMFVEELQANPEVWAIFRVLDEGKKWTSTAYYQRNYPHNLKFAQRTVDERTVVYAMWVITDLHTMGLNSRIINCLRRIGCQTIDDVCRYSRNDLLYLNNMGEKSVSVLENKLAEIGRELSQVDHSADELHQHVRAAFQKRLNDER